MSGPDLQVCGYHRARDMYEAARRGTAGHPRARQYPIIEDRGAEVEALAALGVRAPCRECWACRTHFDGAEPPFFEDADAPPASALRELAAGAAAAEAAFAAHERGDVEDPYALLEVWL